ncbi:Metallothionein expression activator [Saxophila tyrrhenica]|uniref:Metallothionein expression activator n=1 Tax=Saxophila tyrrhenica TaxID=1690608 RepID=A0AAV9PC35_9PEZI|nr:Metallothionein expression activator [Saxophila tyrrhenica]
MDFPPEQHRHLDQPGHLAQDFRFNPQQQQQQNGNGTPAIVAPTPTHPNQEQALQELQHHLEWYQQKFGHSPVHQPQPDNFVNLNQPLPSDMSLEGHMPQQPMINLPRTVTPVSQGHARTVPNTPQHYVQSWPSPPPTDVKHARSQSFQYDVAPMPMGYDGHTMQIPSSPYAPQQTGFSQESFSVNCNDGYASSAYSSSAIDPMSPRCNNIGAMPTVFEEPTPPLGDGFDGDNLLHATAGASDDFNSPSFMVGGSMGGMSPRTAMLHNLGEDVNASIVETGVPPEQVDAYISHQDPNTKGWTCQFMEDNHKPCGKFFKRKENARSHVQNHLGDRQFCCNDCGKTFVRQHDMKRHAAIHKDDRPHVCPCGSGFARHDALTRHRQRGMCKGALPGFEKNEEDKPKRGRPKKERPDMDSRTSKAKKARKLDRAHGQTATAASYASSSSSRMTDNNSLPMTPPDSSDFIDPTAFINLVETPPTSPPSPQKSACISPAALNNTRQLNVNSQHYDAFTGVSSPSTGGDYDTASFNFGAVAAEPDVAGGQSLFEKYSENPFSPGYDSIPGSSPPSCGEELDFGGGMDGMLEGMGWGENAGMGEGVMAMMLDRWIAEQ